MPKLWQLRAAWRSRHRVGDNSPLSFLGDNIRPMPDKRAEIAKGFTRARADERRRAMDYLTSALWRQN
jgi:hypothetical protein